MQNAVRPIKGCGDWMSEINNFFVTFLVYGSLLRFINPLVLEEKLCG